MFKAVFNNIISVHFQYNALQSKIMQEGYLPADIFAAVFEDLENSPA